MLANRDDRIAAIGVSLWLVVGLIFGILFRNASFGTIVLVGTGWFCSVIVFAPQAVANLFGPVFLYETVRVGRRRLTFILRTLYLLSLTFALGIVFLLWLESIGAVPWNWRNTGGIRPGQMARYGEWAFYTFAPIQYFVIVLLTPAYVAGIIADEKERKTLEFLFATDLRNREIIFGKLAARLLTLTMYIIAGLPLLASLMLFGGIDPEWLLGAYAGTILTMITLASVSIYFSTIFKRPRDAIVVSYLMIGAYYIATGFLSVFLTTVPFMMRAPVVFLGYEIPVAEIGAWVGAINPGYLLFVGGGMGMTIDALAFRFVVTCIVITLLTLLSSIRSLRTIATSQSYGIRSAKEKKQKVKITCGDDPVFWKEVFVDGQRRKPWAHIIAGLLVFTLVFMWPILIFCFCYLDQNYNFKGFNSNDNRHFSEGMSAWCRGTTGVLSFLMMMGAATRGASTITTEKDRDTWISLISTPLNSWNILMGKWWGSVLSVRPILYLLFIVWLIAVFTGATLPFMLVPAIVQLVVYVIFFAWLGVFVSCTARTTLIASIRVMMAALFLTGGFWILSIFCCWMPLGILNIRGDSAEILGTSMLSFTPPFVMGWMPLRELNEMEPFSFDHRPHMGPSAILFSEFIWLGGTILFAYLSYNSLQKQTNRKVVD